MGVELSSTSRGTIACVFGIHVKMTSYVVSITERYTDSLPASLKIPNSWQVFFIPVLTLHSDSIPTLIGVVILCGKDFVCGPFFIW